MSAPAQPQFGDESLIEDPAPSPTKVSENVWKNFDVSKISPTKPRLQYFEPEKRDGKPMLECL